MCERENERRSTGQKESMTERKLENDSAVWLCSSLLSGWICIQDVFLRRPRRNDSTEETTAVLWKHIKVTSKPVVMVSVAVRGRRLNTELNLPAADERLQCFLFLSSSFTFVKLSVISATRGLLIKTKLWIQSRFPTGGELQDSC